MRPFSAKSEMVAYLARRDGFVCRLCSGGFLGPRDVTIDHIIPRSLGGTLHPANLRLAHAACNRQRGATLPTPDEQASILAASAGRIEDAWRALGVELKLRRSQRRSRFVRRLKQEGHLTPGEVGLALAVLLALLEAG